MNKKADMGMGTLIIFIAMILVAAVAASVLISTTTKLQNKALDTGKLTTQEVGTGLSAVEVYGEDGSDQSLDYWFETIKLSAGSEPIRFSDVLISFSLNDQSSDLSYSSSIDCSDTSGFSSSTFGIEYQINGTNNKDGYLNKGDVVKLCFQSVRAVSESEDIKIQIVPKVGSILVIETTTPDLMVDKRIAIYP